MTDKNERLSEGSLVVLRSGGPLMTVDGAKAATGCVSVAWFSFDGTLLSRDVFAEASLIQVGSPVQVMRVATAVGRD